jgi:hypothetical protein
MHKLIRKHAVYIFGSIVLCVVVWILLLCGTYPQFYHFQDVTKIVIRINGIDENDNWPNPIYRKIDVVDDRELVYYERILAAPAEIDRFRKVLGVTWDGFIPLNSHELTDRPRYNIKIVQNDGSVDSLIFNQREWGNAGVTPKRMIDYIKKIVK